VWDAFVRLSPQRNIFCMSSFIEACSEEHEFLFVESDGEPLLGAILFPEKDRRLRSAPRPFTMYQGVLFSGAMEALKPHTRVGKQLQLTEFLLAELEKSYANIEFCLHPSFPDIRSFSWFHYHERGKGIFQVTVGYTGLINLSGFTDADDFLTRVRTTRRQEARSAVAKGWSMEESKDVALLDELHQRTFDRQKTERPEEASHLVRSIAKCAVEEGFGEILLSRNAKGEVASAVLYLFDDRCGYYLFGANDPTFRKDACGSMLLTEAVMRCKKQGCTSFDVVGINSPARGDYKTSFNAVPVPYYTVRWEKLGA
jgi:hypothetical protein